MWRVFDVLYIFPPFGLLGAVQGWRGCIIGIHLQEHVNFKNCVKFKYSFITCKPNLHSTNYQTLAEKIISNQNLINAISN